MWAEETIQTIIRNVAVGIEFIGVIAVVVGGTYATLRYPFSLRKKVSGYDTYWQDLGRATLRQCAEE